MLLTRAWPTQCLYLSGRAADLRLEALKALDVIATHPAGMESLVRAGKLEAVAASSAVDAKAVPVDALQLLLKSCAHLPQRQHLQHLLCIQECTQRLPA